MDIETEEKYTEIVHQLLEFYPLFEKALDDGDIADEVRNFLLEDLDGCYSTLLELKEEIQHVSLPKKRFATKKNLFSEKLLAFLYSAIIRFCETDKVKGIPLSKDFLENLKGIMTSKNHVHHSHISGEIIGYTHSFCNARIRENKYKITVIAYNLFRFDFFFLLKGLKAGVWKTRDLNIGGKNPTDINFANIGNQVLFLDTIKYFQQSLGALANSLTDNGKSAISKECERFVRNGQKLA